MLACLHAIFIAYNSATNVARKAANMLTLTLASQKGGSGKTTLALHLAAEAAGRGLKTLLLDLDPQASAARWADRRGDRAPDVSSEHPARLVAALAAAEAEGYDLAVVDTAPHADQAALLAARAADRVVVPCRPSILDLDAIGATLDLCLLARRPAVVVLNAAPIRSKVVEEAAAAVRKLGGDVAEVVIRERVAFRHALVDGRVAREYEPGGAAALEVAALYGLLTRNPENMHVRKHANTKAS
jgi:chromosome partitioning protein